MVESLLVTLFPVVFLIGLFGGGALFRRRNIDMGGDVPIDRVLFYVSKYLMLAIWGATVAHTWGLRLAVIGLPLVVKWAALFLWAAGFLLLFCGRFGLGASFRIGTPREETALKVGGLFRYSRNPMYLGVYVTLLASVLYTADPLVLAAGVFVIAVHHRIVLAEEKYLRLAFGEGYGDYCGRVRRYL